MGNIDSVTLRQKKLKDGRMSLYLDYYSNGVREYEFLKLYLSPEKKDKDENKRVMQLAEAIRAKRLIDIQNSKHGFKPKAKVLVLPYAKEHTEIKVYEILRKTLQPNTTFEDLDHARLAKIREYIIKSNWKQNTKAQYWMMVRAVLHKAEKEELYDGSALRAVENIKTEDTKREYLTIEEIKMMANAELSPCQAEIRRMFMFSVCTGLRWCDVQKLKWCDIVDEGEGKRLIFRQQKTRGQEYMDLSPSAVEWLPETKQGDDYVFKQMSEGYCFNSLKRITKKAGITKHISFHCARHTFACMLIDLNTDLYTISKLLGHRNIATTQIYAKIRDKQKKEAVNKIPSFTD